MLETLHTALFWPALLALLWNGYFLLFNGGVPNISTARPLRTRAIEIIRQEYAIRSGETYIVFDLGSGNGSMTRAIGRALPNAQVVGLEISPLAIAQARLWSRFRGPPNVSYRCGDYFTQDLSVADAIFVFAIPAVMRRLGPKLAKELRPGAVVLSNRFPLPQPWETEAVTYAKILLPGQGVLYLYRQGFQGP